MWGGRRRSRGGGVCPQTSCSWLRRKKEKVCSVFVSSFSSCIPGLRQLLVPAEVRFGHSGWQGGRGERTGVSGGGGPQPLPTSRDSGARGGGEVSLASGKQSGPNWRPDWLSFTCLHLTEKTEHRARRPDRQCEGERGWGGGVGSAMPSR